MKTKEVIEYLKGYPEDSDIGIIAADVKARKVFTDIKTFMITDQNLPVFCFDVGGARDMDKEELEAVAEEEAEDAMWLIEKDTMGNWMLRGVYWEQLEAGAVISKDISDRLYMALCKLKAYEATGLSPEEIEDYLENIKSEQTAE